MPAALSKPPPYLHPVSNPGYLFFTFEKVKTAGRRAVLRGIYGTPWLPVSYDAVPSL
ncbi:hypothetical protein DVH05_022047 [Phytophthora capsici]|nr:hypothetical protein DVH05_022047 [Phytophthora capsici]